MKRSRLLLAAAATTVLAGLIGTAAAAAGAATPAPEIVTYGYKDSDSHYDYIYAGRDWALADVAGNVCGTGKQQSPINVPFTTALVRVPAAERSTFDYGVVAAGAFANGSLANNSHTVQLSLPAGFAPSNASVVIVGSANATAPHIAQNLARTAGQALTRVPMKPLQLHFHARSEHLVGGRTYPIEMHIVNAISKADAPGCPASPGCLAVVGVLFELAGDGEAAASESAAELDKLFDAIARVEVEDTATQVAGNVTLNLGKLLPADKTYATYAGSLTTPPCTEGVLWHLLTAPVKITADQLYKFELAIGDSVCPAAAAPAPAPLPSRRLLATNATANATTNGTTNSTANVTAAAGAAAGFAYPAADAEGCRKGANNGNYRVEMPLNGRILRLSTDKAPCFAAVPAAALNGSVMTGGLAAAAAAADAANANNASAPLSVAGYEWLAAAKLTAPCPAPPVVAAGAAGVAHAGLGGIALAAALAVAAAALF